MKNWYLDVGKESDVVISSRIRIARNIQEFLFVPRAKKEDYINILNKVEYITPSIGYGLKFIRLKDIDDISKMSLVEKHLISPEFALNKENTGAILINEEENICIMINEEDHFRIQVFGAGLDVENIANLAIEVEEKIGKLLNYAYSKKYGFLTSCPTNVGTGMRCSIMVHLPGLSQTGNINKILEIVNGLGLNIRGIYGEGSNAQGNIFQISNKKTLGVTEQEIIKNTKAITEQIIAQERNARKHLLRKEIELEDRVYRAYGVLKHCRKISSNECKEILSDIRLGTDLGIIKELNDVQVNKLEIYTRPANLQKYLGEKLDIYRRDVRRAEVIKDIIREN